MNGKYLIAVAIAGLTVSLSSGGANAVPVNPDVLFTITSDTEPTLTFEVPQSPRPETYVGGFYFEIIVPITVNGLADGQDAFNFYDERTLDQLSDLRFFTSLGGITSPRPLFTGTAQSPTFLLGSFPGVYTDSTGAIATALITISPTPLPSTWLMLLSGFVGLGFFAYRGSRKNPVALAAA
jgi:hypothetical protein